MDDGSGWLELLVRDASAAEITAYGASLRERGVGQAADTTVALQLKSLLQQRAQRAGELAALNDIAGRLSALTSPADVLPEVVDQARRLLRVDLAYLGLVAPTAEPAMRIEVASGTLTSELLTITIPLTAGLAGYVITEGRPRWVSDYRTDPSIRHHAPADEATLAENMHGLLGVPLAVRGRVIGALFAGKRTERRFSDDEVALLAGLAAHAAIAIDNAQGLERLASARDALAARTAELERTLAWDQRLTQVALRGGGSEDLLTEVSSAATAAVVFARPGQTAELLGGSDVESLPADSPVALDREPHTVVRRVVAGNREFGILALQCTAPISREDILLLDRAAPVLGLALIAEGAVAEASRYSRDSLLVELLTTTAAEADWARRQARRAGLNPTRSYVVAVVDAPEGVDDTRRLLDAMDWPTGSLIAACQGNVVVLAPAIEPAALTALWHDAENRPTAGVAGPAPAARLHEIYQQGVQVLEAQLALGMTGSVSTAEQLGVYGLLLSHSGRRALDAAFSRLLGPVQEEQERKGVPLLATLEQFLSSGRRPRAAADRLSIHVNTLYQRLSSIDSVLGPRWRDDDRALELQLVFHLRRGSGFLD
ncbi:helix-turn-helix domain-containing protein [Amycolatopsis sp. cmx-4-68]|uniref:helix-turn-helix domain-containing protein n=1 Tax=Amycolatopsis sp. cmx-4-68 TaxID=2790938 RepID=UPI0039793FAE